MVVPASVKFTVPATLAVATIVVEPLLKMALGSVKVIVGVVVDADAVATPKTATLPNAMVPATTADINLFIWSPLRLFSC